MSIFNRHLRTQNVVKPQREVSIFRRVVANKFQVLTRERRLWLAALGLAGDILEADHAVAEQLLRKFLEAVARGGIEAVVLEHRVARSRSEADAVAVQDGAVVLAVVRDEDLRLVGEKRPEHVDKIGDRVPRLSGGGRERNAEKPACPRVRRAHSRLARRGLDVERDARRGHKLRKKRLRRRFVGDKPVVVRRRCNRGMR